MTSMDHRLALIVACTMAAAHAHPAAARAGNPGATFTLAKPLPDWRRAIVEEHVFLCEKDRCTGAIEPLAASQMRTCRDLRRRFGEIVSVRIGNEQWETAKLESCNKAR